MGMSYGFGALVPVVLMGIVFAIPAWWLAPKMGDRRWVWVVLMLIPVVNSFAIMFLPFRAAGAILDRLNALAKQ